MIKVGVIGMAFGADFHVPAFARLDGVEITALADGGSGRAAELAAALPSAPSVYACGEELIATENIDVVSIATPPQFQLNLVLAAINAGKGVLCEKPLGLSVAESEAMFQAAEYHKVNTSVGFEMRYDRGISALAKVVHAGRVGDVDNISVKWLTGGGNNPKRVNSWRDDKNKCAGIIGEYGVHVFDYARWILQSRISSVHAKAETAVMRRPDKNGTMHPVTVPDSFDVDCEFENGATGQFVVSNVSSTDHGHKVAVTGDKGTISMQLHPPYQEADIELIFADQAGVSQAMPMPKPSTGMTEDTRRGAFNALVDDFINRQSIDLPGFSAGVAAQQVIAAIQRSLVSGASEKTLTA